MLEQRKILTVSQITKDIKIVLENTFVDVWVEGEVSNYIKSQAGHIYFTLKDEAAQLKCVFFYNANKGLRFELKDGASIVVFGRISVYKPQGQYQLYAQVVEPKGLGKLQLAFEQLKEKLNKEGLFREERKRPLPLLPLKIGVVTSGVGAAIRDILTILKRRAPFVSVIINPVKVQGEGAAGEIAGAINDFNIYSRVREKIDVLIVGRGGGSLEDLWAFNEEIVARAIYDSEIPVISAVGHEVDYTIADFVADLRAPTPSAAAEIVIKKKEEIVLEITNNLSAIRSYVSDAVYDYQQKLDEEKNSLHLNARHCLEMSLQKHKNLSARIRLLHPRNIVMEKIKQVEYFKKLMNLKIDYALRAGQDKTNTYTHRLSALSPLAILSRGYSLSTLLDTGTVLRDISQVKTGERVKTKLGKGVFVSIVEKIEVT